MEWWTLSVPIVVWFLCEFFGMKEKIKKMSYMIQELETYAINLQKKVEKMNEKKN